MASIISFAGMASGLDTDAIVEAMVSNYKLKADKSAKQEILLEWKQDNYKDVSKKVYDFYTGISSKLRLESTFNKKLLTASNTTAIKLDPTSTVMTGAHTLSNLTMATNASMKTHQITTTDGKSVTSETTLEALGIKADRTITFTDVKGQQTTIKFKNSSVSDSSQQATVESSAVEQEFDISDSVGKLESFLKANMSGNTVSFDSNVGAFFIGSSSVGAKQSFQVSGDTEVLQSLGFLSKTQVSDVGEKNSIIPSTDKNITTIKIQGSDASYTYNGSEFTSTSNNISVNGLKFTITSNTNEVISISSTEDTDNIFDTIKTFVNEYNTLISDLNKLINAASAGSYEPLLDDEKKELTDSEIEKWEKKIKYSLLKDDSTLKSLTSSMRNILSGTFSTNSTYKSLSDIGITTSSDWTANGKLELDEEKLKQAISNNADEIVALFAANGTDEKPIKGIGDRLYDSLGNSFKRISNVKSATSLFNDMLISKERTTQSETTSKLEDRLEKMKEMYLKRFTAMETALSKLNSQTDTLTSLLSS